MTGHSTDTEREALAALIAERVYVDTSEHYDAADAILASDWLAAQKAAAVEAALAPVRALIDGWEAHYQALGWRRAVEYANDLRAVLPPELLPPAPTDCPIRCQWSSTPEGCNCRERLATVTTHTRTAHESGPDYCAECSEACQEWVEWTDDHAPPAPTEGGGDR